MQSHLMAEKSGAGIFSKDSLAEFEHGHALRASPGLKHGTALRGSNMPGGQGTAIMLPTLVTEGTLRLPDEPHQAAGKPLGPRKETEDYPPPFGRL